MSLKQFLTALVIATIAIPCAHAQQTAKITSKGTGYLEYLPDGYNSNLNKYPIVIFLHGIGEKGTTSTDPATIKASLEKVAKVAIPKYIKYGAEYPFIVISPQLKSSYSRWTSAYVMEVLNHVRKYLRIDESRIYLTGLSLGGYGVWTTVGDYPSTFAAIAPVCSGGSALSKACAIAAENVAIWAFHGDKDGVVSYTVTTRMVNAVNACTPKPSPLAKTTIFSGMGHSIWDKAYKETGVLNWLLNFKNGSASSTPANEPPLAKAGGDKTITLPASSAKLYGSATDPDGTIAAYSWSQVSGPSSATLTNKTTKTLTASALRAGTYTFRLKATDNDGASDTDDVKVIVRSSDNSLPTVYAGVDKTVTLPTNYLYLQGSASDPDGTIASYKWTKVSGSRASISGSTTLKAKAYNLEEGSYVFRLTVTDNDGGVKYDDMRVTVKAATSITNILPVANAGPDKKIVLPANSLTLYGSASDKDGNIVSYKWTKIKGPAVGMSGTTSPTVKITGLVEGSYYFMLTVKDDKGAIDTDKMLVKVYPAGYNL